MHVDNRQVDMIMTFGYFRVGRARVNNAQSIMPSPAIGVRGYNKSNQLLLLDYDGDMFRIQLICK